MTNLNIFNYSVIQQIGIEGSRMLGFLLVCGGATYVFHRLRFSTKLAFGCSCIQQLPGGLGFNCIFKY